MAIDIKFDFATGTLPLDGGDLQLVRDADAVAQRVGIRMRTLGDKPRNSGQNPDIGEWYLDTTRGVPYYTKIFVKSPDLNDVGAILFDQIAGAPDINEVTAFELDYDEAARSLTLDWEAETVFGIAQGEL